MTAALELTQAGGYLGAARMVREEAGAWIVALEEPGPMGRIVVHATTALTVPYRAVVGDQLLVVGDEQAFFVIGVLRGRGSTAFEGERVSVRAGGSLRLRGDRGVRIEGPALRLRADRLHTLALDAIETLGQRQRVVRELLRREAGEVDEHSEGRWLLAAKRVVIKALENARIKSTTVRVG